MESAVETNRIERNMKRVAAFMGIPENKLHIDIQMDHDNGECKAMNTDSFSKFQKMKG